MSALPMETAAERPPSTSMHWGWWIVYAALALLPTVWAADTSFISDEPLVIGHALRANAEGRWETAGISGTVGRIYGPLPVWVYQVGLKITSDPITLIQLRAVLFMAVTLAGAAWIAWLIRTGGAWVLLIGLSPYMLRSSRVLWDNSFNIPLAAIATAAALHVVIRRSLWPLPSLLALFGAMALIHPMSLAMDAGIIVFLTVYWRRLSGKTKGQYAAVIGGLLLVALIGWWISAGYRAVVMGGPSVPFVVAPEPNGWWFALFSPRIISAVWLQNVFGDEYLAAMPMAQVLDVAQVVSAGVFVLAWAGIPLTFLGLRRRPQDIATMAGVLALCTLIAQIGLNAYTHTFGQPHYYNATWPAAAILVAVTTIRLSQTARYRSLGTAALLILAAALAISTGLIAQRIHATGGSRQPTCGATIANQLEIVDTIRGCDPHSRVHFKAIVLPISIQTLLWWTQGDTPPAANLPTRNLVLQYVHPDDPWDGRVELVDAPPAP